MDLIYMSDAMAYQSVRGPLSFYDNRSWDNKSNKKSQDKHQKSSSCSVPAVNKSNNVRAVSASKSHHNKSGGEPCRICQEQQRRALRSYIRTKSHEEREERCIVEENEEQETEEDQLNRRLENISVQNSLPVDCRKQSDL